MDIEIKTWLYDIITAIQEIDSFLADQPTDSALQTDLKTRRAIKRNIEIIGEAMSRILQKDDTFQLSNSRKIVDTRNRIIHGYDTVSDDIITSMVLKHLPLLNQKFPKFLVLNNSPTYISPTTHPGSVTNTFLPFFLFILSRNSS